MKKTPKSSPAGIPLQNEFSAVAGGAAGVKPPAGGWWTGAQFAVLVPSFDEPKLRRLGIENNPATGAPWIPKPRAAKFEFTPTLKGVIAYLLHQNTQPSGYPDKFASQKDFATQTPFSIEMLDFIRKKGHACILPGSRVDFRKFLEGVAAQGIDKIDFIDGDYEEKRLTRERADEQAMLNAEKRGEVLFSRDQQHAVAELHASEVLFEQFLAPLKKQLLDRAKRAALTYEDLVALLAEAMKHLPPELVAKSEVPADGHQAKGKSK